MPSRFIHITVCVRISYCLSWSPTVYTHHLQSLIHLGLKSCEEGRLSFHSSACGSLVLSMTFVERLPFLP